MNKVAKLQLQTAVELLKQAMKEEDGEEALLKVGEAKEAMLRGIDAIEVGKSK